MVTHSLCKAELRVRFPSPPNDPGYLLSNMNPLITNFLILVGICYIISFIISVIYRLRHPSKKSMIEEGCRLVMYKIATKRNRKYFTTFTTLKHDLKFNVVGVNKENVREITKCVLDKLIENKILELDNHLEVDVYHEI